MGRYNTPSLIKLHTKGIKMNLLFKLSYLNSYGLSVAGLNSAKFGFYRLQNFLFVVVIVISVLLKAAF